MGERLTFGRWIRRILYFFPFQLLVLHFKKNHILLLLWLVLFGFITNNLGTKYGVPYLFLYPEYFGQSSFWSFGLLGFALGGFFTAYNLYSYTTHAYRFPFVATIARPFMKFSLNNSLLPVLFVITYLISSAYLQWNKELIPALHVAINLTGFLFGIGVFMLLSLMYFTRTNTDVHKILGSDPNAHRAPEPMEDIMPHRPAAPVQRTEIRKATRWLRREQRTKKWKVETYLTSPWRVALARSSSHYDKELLRSVLWQNHINASIFEVVLVVSFIALGAFSGNGLFDIPAGASAFLLFTMLLMLFSALYSWLAGWTITVMAIIFIGVNLISLKTETFLYDAEAYGMDYDTPPAKYDQVHVSDLAQDTAAARQDARALQPMLDAWLANNRRLPAAYPKPRLVIINTSGGGSRAMLWTFRCLQVADSLLGGDLMRRTMLITGSSGGLIGATCYRQMELRSGEDSTINTDDPAHLEAMASDILNPVSFSFVTNDMFLRYRRVHDGLRSYTRDRGSAFEDRLNVLTQGVLDVRLEDMVLPEMQARTPMLVVTPTSINDGRRLIIASQNTAFLSCIAPSGNVAFPGQPESIEFRRLFADQDPGHLKLSTALRMNATFPYITPVVSLPSEPKMRVMDAGLRDNYGYRTTISFLQTFNTWIAENTSGVVILQMRDMQRELDISPVAGSLFGRLLDPVGSVYSNVVKVQDQDYDLMLKQAETWTKFPLEVVDLQLRHANDEGISLSWHLTAVEKRHVLNMIHAQDNQQSFGRLKDLVLGEGPRVTASAAGDSGSGPEVGPVLRR